MMNEKAVNQIHALISDHLGVAKTEVRGDAKFIEDLGADSLDTVELVMALEEKFGIEITDEEAESIQTVGAAIELIDKKVATIGSNA